MSGSTAQSAFEVIVHIIQVALTPIFLLTGIAGLLSVFSTRHSYVTQHVDQILANVQSDIAINPEHLHKQLRNLRFRSIVLDVAVIFGILGGASTCLTAMILFVGQLDDAATALYLSAAFGGALTFAVFALAAFAIEMMMAGWGLRLRMTDAQTLANQTAHGQELARRNHATKTVGSRQH